MNRRTATRPQPTPKPSALPATTTRKGPTSPRGSGAACKQKQVVSANVLFIILVLFIAGIYGLVVYAFYEVEVTPGANHPGDKYNSPNKLGNERRMMRGTAKKTSEVDTSRYPYWRDLAVRLAAMPAKELLKALNETDPFGVRHFDQALLEQETKLGRLLEHHEIEGLFPCPSSRITLPDQRNLQKAKEFRDNKPGSFLFFQHLRKGTLREIVLIRRQFWELPNSCSVHGSRWHPLLFPCQG